MTIQDPMYRPDVFFFFEKKNYFFRLSFLNRMYPAIL